MAAAAPSNSEMADVHKNVEEVGRLQEGGLVVDVVDDDDKPAEAGCAAPAAAAAMVTLHGSPFTARVKRPSHRNKDEAAQEQLEEVLSVQLTLARHQFYHMNLFINLPSASEATPIASCPQFASAFNHIPLIIAPGAAAADAGRVGLLALAQHTTLFRVGISDIVSQLGLSLHPYLLVTFVPTGRFKDAPLTIDNITIDLE